MTSEKIDRRVKYTKMVLRNSLTQLLETKPISRITIKELCEIADINRATFYAHYSDQFDLLKKIEQELLNDINSYLDIYIFKETSADSLQIMTKIFEYIKQNEALCRALLGPNGDIELQKDIVMIVSQRSVIEWESKSSLDEESANYLYTFAATGSLGIVQKWLLDDSAKTPAQMAELVMKLTTQGFSAFLS